MSSGNAEWIVCPTPPDGHGGRGCWFCGAPFAGPRAKRKAREHVFAQWLLTELGANTRPFGVTWNDALEREVLDQRAMVLDAFVAGRVFKDCNNG
jgi:hypothetical protein